MELSLGQTLTGHQPLGSFALRMRHELRRKARVGAVGDDVEAVLALDDVAPRPSVDDFDANPKSRGLAGGLVRTRRRLKAMVGE